MFSLHTSLKASAVEDSKRGRETQRRKRSGESSRPAVVAVQLEGRGKDQRERLGAGLRSCFTSALLVCNPKLSILQSVHVGAFYGQLSPRDQGSAWSGTLQD